MTLSDAQIAAAAQQAGFHGNAVVIAVAVALAESGGNPGATHRNTNGSTDYGLWQINSVHRSQFGAAFRGWADPATNAHMAYVISNGGRDWLPWTTYKTGSYSRYVGRARRATKAGAAVGLGDTAQGDLNTPPSPSSSGGGFSLTDSTTWLRVAMFIGGSIALLLAILALAGREIPTPSKLARAVL